MKIPTVGSVHVDTVEGAQLLSQFVEQVFDFEVEKMWTNGQLDQWLSNLNDVIRELKVRTSILSDVRKALASERVSRT